MYLLSHAEAELSTHQHTLTFYYKPIIVVRLPDGRPGVVLRFLCESLHIDINAQLQRVQGSEVMAEDLIFTQGEPQAQRNGWPYWCCVPSPTGLPP